MNDQQFKLEQKANCVNFQYQILDRHRGLTTIVTWQELVNPVALIIDQLYSTENGAQHTNQNVMWWKHNSYNEECNTRSC